jgi:tetratricopeptide (TPR) repeat protein
MTTLLFFARTAIFALVSVRSFKPKRRLDKAGIKVVALSTAAAALMLLPQVGSAQTLLPQAEAAVGEGNLGYQAIRNKDWATAERQLLAGLQQNPSNVFRQLNLAWVYAQTGRKAEAAAIYERVLKGDENRVAALASREGVPVKQLAERGLSLLENR